MKRKDIYIKRKKVVDPRFKELEAMYNSLQQERTRKLHSISLVLNSKYYPRMKRYGWSSL